MRIRARSILAFAAVARAAADPLSMLAMKYGTDKASHGFTRFYDSIFNPQQDGIRLMMEIGVFGGASIQMWAEYFSKATVVGVDNFMCGLRSDQKTEALRRTGGNRGCLSKNLAEAGRRFRDAVHRGEHGPRIRILSANQSDVGELAHALSEFFPVAGLHGSFDLIVEDGSHMHRDQQMNIALLFPLVRPGGYYVIEDIHSSFQNKYDEKPGSKHTTHSVMSKFNQTRTMRSKHMSTVQQAYLERWIEYSSIKVTKVYRTDQTCLIRKLRA
jgi:demethylmacrocin O-methyltransferase